MITKIADIETDDINATVIHCIAVGDLEGKVNLYADHPNYLPIEDGVKELEDADRVVMHNGLNFDYPIIAQLTNAKIKREKVFDTLILSRFIDPRQRKHSLAEWGERLGFPKGDFKDFEKFTDEMATYCIRDVEVTTKLYKHLMEKFEPEMAQALRTEFDFAYVLGIQERHGFRLDVKAAQDLAAEMRQEMSDIEDQLQSIFLPRVIERYSDKTGNRLKDKIEVFNPGSRKQIGERLTEKYGWKPTKYTPQGAPQIDEKVLNELNYPEAKLLGRYFLCQKQLSQISEGDAGWLKRVTKDGYVHGKVNTIGTNTFRCSHFSPNMAQISKRDLRMREVWLPDEGDKLVGVDADALELRMLAAMLGHFDDGAYAKALLEGSKEDGTDVHSRTGKIVGVENRDVVKRLTYAYLYGASDRKLSQILREGKAPLSDGKIIRHRMNQGITGLGTLADILKSKYERGYLIGVDGGRRIPIVSEHSMLNFLLQSMGAIVMKKALCLFHYELAPAAGHVVDDQPQTFNYCANVHDEVQLTVRPQHAEEIGQLFADAIKLAGERLELKCPLSGSYDVGANWKETH